MPESNQEKKLSKTRNIGIIAHIDGGKTTTTERMLYLCKRIHKIREVRGKEDDGKGATMDYMKLEKEKGITIQSAATNFEWKEYWINLIDTPGHVDFTAEVERALRVLDGAIVILDGKEGVEAQTETVWKQANKYKIPRLIFINKMDSIDREEKFTENLKSIQEKLNTVPLVVQFPIGFGKELAGVVDVVGQKAYYYQMGDKEENYQVKEIPSNLLEKTKNYRQILLEKIIEQDEKLAMKYLEGQELQVEEVKKLLRKATLSGECFPVFCGSAYKHVGVKLLLDGVVDYLPSPLDIPEIPALSLQDENKKILINCNSSLPYLALVFKIIFDDRNQRITFIRVYAGKISAGSTIYNVNRQEEERVGNLVRMHANSKEIITEVEAGDIAAIIGLKHAVTGDTFSEKNNPLLLENISFAEPVISQAIEPKTKEDKDKLRTALDKLKVQDPSFKYRIDRETGQMIISGMGELHLEVSVERLRREYKLNIESKQQKVSYRETITKKLENVEAWYKKKTGGRGHDARVWITFEPVVNNEIKNFERILNEAEKKTEVKSLQERLNQWGIKLGELENSNRNFEAEINQLKPRQLTELKEIRDRVEKDAWQKRKKKYSVSNDFVDAKKGQEMSNKDAEEVKEGLEEIMSSGLLLNYPVLDVKATLLGGKRHEVDTQPGDFKQAAILAFRGDGTAEREKKIRELGAVLLEPIMQLEVAIPKDYLGDVLANLTSRRAIIENTGEEEGESYITGNVPLREILNYSAILRQLTKGHGTYSMHLSHYQEVPADVLEEILKEEKL